MCLHGKNIMNFLADLISLSTFRTMVLKLFWVTEWFGNVVKSTNPPIQKRIVVTYTPNLLDFQGFVDSRLIFSCHW